MYEPPGQQDVNSGNKELTTATGSNIVSSPLGIVSTNNTVSSQVVNFYYLL